jgi:hypothetical protein
MFQCCFSGNIYFYSILFYLHSPLPNISTLLFKQSESGFHLFSVSYLIEYICIQQRGGMFPETDRKWGQPGWGGGLGRARPPKPQAESKISS